MYSSMFYLLYEYITNVQNFVIFIKKLLDVTNNPFWVDVLKAWLYVVTDIIH